MSGYDFPPSKHILEFGPLEADSHFYARGTAQFDVAEVNCDFEVAYTQDCRVVVVAYLEDENYLLVFGNKVKESGQPLFRQDEVRCIGLSGRDVISYQIIS